MNLPKFPHSAMFIGVTACGKTEFLLRLLETIYKNHFEFIVILCPTVLDNKTYLSRKWIFDDKNVFIVCGIVWLDFRTIDDNRLHGSGR